MNLNQEISFKKTPRLLTALTATVFGAGALGYWALRDTTEALPYNQFMAEAESGSITKITETSQLWGEGRLLKGFTATNPNEAVYSTVIPVEENPYERIKDAGVEYTAVSGNEKLLRFGQTLLPITIAGALLLFLMRQMRGGGIAGDASAKLPSEKIYFDDVAGQEEAKEELREIVDFLKNPKKYRKLGAKIPKGVLMAGSPGLGKTLLAKAIATEAGVPFYGFSGSDFTQVFAGVGAARVRKIFADANENSPSLIFIDELDAMGGQRGANEGYNKEYNNTLNAILAEMDGVGSNSGVIVIAATNRIDTLDEALVRPGRFDRHVHMNLPESAARRALLNVHTRNKPLAPDIDFEPVIGLTPRCSGADLANIVNEAAIAAAKADREFITTADLEAAVEKQMMGPPRRSLELTQEDRERIAYHEAGHVITERHLPAGDKLHKVTIVPRGPGGGVTWLIPQSDTLFETVGQIKNKIAYLAGGRWAEIRHFGGKADTASDAFNQDLVSNGASNDIDVVTEMAQTALTQWGASDKLGFIRYGADSSLDGKDFLGRDEKTAALIAEETRNFVSAAYKKAGDVIKEHWSEVEAVAQALLTYDTLSAAEVESVIAGQPLSGRQPASLAPAI